MWLRLCNAMRTQMHLVLLHQPFFPYDQSGPELLHGQELRALCEKI